MNVVVLAVLLSGVPQTEPQPPETRRRETTRAGVGALPNGDTLEKTGLFGWGIGLQLPMVGLTAGIGSKSRVGAGYTYGGSVTFEITPRILARIHGNWSATQNGRSSIEFLQAGERISSSRATQWYSLAFGVGGAFMFRSIGSVWTPFAGADVGFSIDGVSYRFGKKVQELEDPQNSLDGRDEVLFIAEDLGFVANLRGGMRLQLTSWLSSMVELSVGYSRLGSNRVSNTLSGPDVRSVPENIYVFRLGYSIWLGL